MFVGLGLAWIYGCFWNLGKGKAFSLSPSIDFVFSVIVYLVGALVCFLIVFWRLEYGDGIIGGNDVVKNNLRLFFLLVYFLFIVLVVLKVDEHIFVNFS